MSRISEQAGKKRLAILVGVIAVIAVAWFSMRGPGVDLIGEEKMTATVIDVIRRDNPPDPNRSRGLVIAIVELPDGGRARVFAPLAKVWIGAEITVKLKHYSDGTRHVIGAYDES